MLDIGWQELLVIGALALIVVGPKDLPGLLRSVGQWVGRVRGMASDFQRAMNDAAREADVADMKEMRDLASDLRKGVDFKEQASKAQSFLDKPADKTAGQTVDAGSTSSASSTSAASKPAVTDTDDPGALAEPLDDAKAPPITPDVSSTVPTPADPVPATEPAAQAETPKAT